ncbi:MAG: hypothetical protein WCR30_02560 [Clostridia bacterium]
MKSSTILTKNHITIFAKLVSKLRKKNTLTVLFLMLGLGIILLTLNFLFFMNEDVFGVATFFIMFSLLYYPVSILTNKLFTLNNKINTRLLDNTFRNDIEYFDTYMIATEFVDGEKISETKFYYSKLSKAVYYNEHLFLFIEPMRALTVSKEDMTHETLTKLMLILKENLKDKFVIYN